MASESPPPGSGDVKPAAQATELPQDATAEGQVSGEPKSVFVNSEPIREDQVQNAVKFLSHPRVQGSPVIHRRNFLERKGLTKEEIDEAFRRVPDPSPGATSAQAATSQVSGQVMTSPNIQQQGSPQTIQPAGVAPPSGVVSSYRRQFHWYHAILAVGFLAASGAGTIIIFKKTLVPRLRSWIRKVVSDDDNDGLEKNDSKPSLYEEAAAAAKAAAVAASDAAKANQEMVIMKSEENKRYEQFMSLLDGQLQEIKSMKTALWKLEGQNYDSGKRNPVEDYLNGPTAPLWKPAANGRADYDSRSARSSSPPVTSEPRHPKSYMDIMGMVQRGERPPNVRDINDAPPNPYQPISNSSLAPRNKPWESVEPARTNSFGSQSPYTGEVSSSAVQDKGNNHQFNNETSTPWWQQQQNARISEIENEDNDQGNRSNGEIPVNQPPQRKWVPPMPPPVAMPEAAIAIRQPKSKAPVEKAIDSTSSNGSEVDELQKVTRISELGGEAEINGGLEVASSSEIQEEQVVN